MSTHLYTQTVPQLDKMLVNLSGWLTEGAETAKAAGKDPESLLELRLAEDMFPLLRQVQVVCDNAKFIPARLAGVAPPSHPDEETTLSQLHERIATTRAYLATFEPSAFEGAADRVISLPVAGGIRLRGEDYLVGFGLPNFYFHVSMVYGLLRHGGAPLGKRAFIGGLTLLPPE